VKKPTEGRQILLEDTVVNGKPAHGDCCCCCCCCCFGSSSLCFKLFDFGKKGRGRENVSFSGKGGEREGGAGSCGL